MASEEDGASGGAAGMEPLQDGRAGCADSGSESGSDSTSLSVSSE